MSNRAERERLFLEKFREYEATVAKKPPTLTFNEGVLCLKENSHSDSDTFKQVLATFNGPQSGEPPSKPGSNKGIINTDYSGVSEEAAIKSVDQSEWMSPAEAGEDGQATALVDEPPQFGAPAEEADTGNLMEPSPLALQGKEVGTGETRKSVPDDKGVATSRFDFYSLLLIVFSIA